MPKVCPQFHLALQSGSDGVLRRMARGYTANMFEEAVTRLRKAFPGAAFTTDILTGFPGETEEEFQETMAACRRIGFARMHVFPYSPRAGTKAASLPVQLSRQVKDQRAEQLIALGEELAAAYHKSLLNTVQPVLLEEKLANGHLQGYTPSYVRVEVAIGAPGQIVNVRLAELLSEGMGGIVEESL